MVVLAMLAAPLTGCIGSVAEPVEAQQAPTEDDGEPEPVGQPATVYRPAADDPGAADAEEAPGNLRLPVGISRVVPSPLFEPTIGVTSGATLFVSNTGKGELSAEDPPPDTECSSILRSQDHGKSWEDVTGSVGPVSIPPETSDPYVYVDEDTDRVYDLDMIQLNCNWVRYSDDEGDSWVNNPLGCGQPPVLDPNARRAWASAARWPRAPRSSTAHRSNPSTSKRETPRTRRHADTIVRRTLRGPRPFRRR